MIISEGKTVAITYTLRLDSGETVDSNVGQEPLIYTHGEEQLIFGLEQALIGKRAGDSLKVSVSPEARFGPPARRYLGGLSSRVTTAKTKALDHPSMRTPVSPSMTATSRHSGGGTTSP